MIDAGLYRRVADAKDALVDASKHEGPNAPRTFAFVIVGAPKTFEQMWDDGPPHVVTAFTCGISTLFGFAIECNRAMPVGTLLMLEKRTGRGVEIKVS